MAWGFLYDPGELSQGLDGAAQWSIDAERLAAKPLIFAFGAVLFLAAVVLIAAHRIEARLPGASPTSEPPTARRD